MLTLLVHLEYLSYHWVDKTVTIPNKEVSQEYVNAISTVDWPEMMRAVEDARELPAGKGFADICLILRPKRRR